MIKVCEMCKKEFEGHNLSRFCESCKKEKNRQKAKRWAEENNERNRQKTKAWRAKNKKRKADYDRNYNKANPHVIKKLSVKTYDKNRAKINMRNYIYNFLGKKVSDFTEEQLRYIMSLEAINRGFSKIASNRIKKGLLPPWHPFEKRIVKRSPRTRMYKRSERGGESSF